MRGAIITVFILVVAGLVGFIFYQQSQYTQLKKEAENKAAEQEKEKAECQAHCATNLPTVKISRKSIDCGNPPKTKYQILLNGQKVKDWEVEFCGGAADVLAINNQKAYFGLEPNEVSGYVLYHRYHNLYSFDLEKQSVERVIEAVSDFAIENSGARVAYHKDQTIYFKNLNSSEEKTFNLPKEIPEGAQIGTLVFSPQLNKLAFAAGWGPENAGGAIYILDLTSGKFKKYETKDCPENCHFWVTYFIDNQTLDYEYEKVSS